MEPRGRFGDAGLEDGSVVATGQGMLVTPSKLQKQGLDCPLESQEGAQPCQYVNFCPVMLIWGFWFPEL